MFGVGLYIHLAIETTSHGYFGIDVNVQSGIILKRDIKTNTRQHNQDPNANTLSNPIK